MGGEALGPALAGQSGLLPGQGAPLWRLVSVLFLRLLAWSPVAQTSVRGDILVDDKPFQLLDAKNYLAATWQVRLKTPAPPCPDGHSLSLSLLHAHAIAQHVVFDAPYNRDLPSPGPVRLRDWAAWR